MYISEIAKAQINLLETLSKIANQVAFRELTQKKKSTQREWFSLSQEQQRGGKEKEIEKGVGRVNCGFTMESSIFSLSQYSHGNPLNCLFFEEIYAYLWYLQYV